MTQNIHPTAFIDTNVTLGEHCIIGPFAVIESGAVLGDHCQLGAHAVVHGHVRMGNGNILHPHAVLGGLPQDTSFKAETESWLVSYRRLSKDYEYLTDTSETMIQLAMIRLMLNRIEK